MRYTLLGILAILLWSSTTALARSLTEQLGTTTTAAAVFLLSGAIGCTHLVLSRKLGRLRRLPRAYLLGSGGLFVLYMVCLYLAIGLAATRVQVIGVGIINYLWPGLTLVFSVPLLGKRARAWLLPGALMAFAGGALAMAQGGSFSWSAFADGLMAGSVPYLLALVAALCWALYSNLSRRWGGKAEGTAVPVFLLASGLVWLALRCLFAEAPQWTLRSAAELLYMATLPTLAAYTFWEAAMRRGNMVLVAALSYFIPLVSTAISCVYLGVRPGANLWTACLLVVAGAVVCKLSLRERAPAPAAIDKSGGAAKNGQ